MASMTFLQLAQRLAQECGVSNTPVSCQNQSGEMLRLVNWISDSYNEIQELHQDWEWLMNDFSFATTAQQQLYTPSQAGISDYGVWKYDSFRAYTTTNNFGDEQIIIPMKYEKFRNQYMYSNMRFTYSRPVAFAIDPPTKGILLGPIPDATGWTILGKYYRQPAVLSADADTPSLPPKYHMIIVYKAMVKYGYFEAAPEVLERGEKEYDSMLAQLEIDQIDGIDFGAPLA